MNLAEWHAVLATEPATPNQIGALMGEFERLGFGEADRAERLAVAAALLSLDELDSVKNLTMGEAGQLYRALLEVRDRGELAAAARLDEADAEPEPGRGPAEPGDQADETMSLGQVIGRIAALVYLALADPGAVQPWPAPEAGDDRG